MKHLLTNAVRQTAKQFPNRSTALAASAKKRRSLALDDAPNGAVATQARLADAAINTCLQLKLPGHAVVYAAVADPAHA